MDNTFPIWLIVFDYILALIMLILILKFVLNIFTNEVSNAIVKYFLFEKDLITLINSSILNIALYLNYGI